MRAVAPLALVLALAACGSDATTESTPEQPTITSVTVGTTTTTTTPSTTTTVSSPDATNRFERVTLDGECSPSNNSTYDLTVTAFGMVESIGTGSLVWNDVEIASLGVELDKEGFWAETLTVAESGSGVFSVSSEGGAIIYSASLTLEPCEVAEAEPDYEFTLSAGVYCQEFYPYLEVIVDSVPFYDDPEPLVLLVHDSDDDTITNEETYFYIGDPMSVDMGGVAGDVYVYTIDAFGTASNVANVTVPDCFLAEVSVITAQATCGDEWTLDVVLNGRPGATGNMFYTWEGALDGEIWDFTLDENGSWSFSGYWPDATYQGTVTLDIGDSGHVPVQILECGE